MLHLRLQSHVLKWVRVVIIATGGGDLIIIINIIGICFNSVLTLRH